MRSIKFGWLVLVAAIALGGARCGSSTTNTQTTDVAQASVSTGVKYTNEPENPSDTIPASAQTIYLSAEIARPTKSTDVQVSWYKIPNQPVATESFAGKRGSSGNQLDFDYKKTSSWLASRIDRPGLSWTLGEYRVEVYLDSKLAKTVFFTIVSDSDAEKANAQKSIKSVSFSDAIDSNDQLVGSKTSFSRDASTIYLQVSVASVPAGTTVEVGVRYVKSGLLLNTFSSVTLGNENLLFSLPRDRFGKLWSDKLWPVGSFEVVTKVGGVVAKTSTFVVKA